MRLIDADELMHRMETVEVFSLKGLMKIAREMVINSPTIDAVEAVRCKDCKYWDSDEETCYEVGGLWRASDFCSWAERKENEAN